MSSTSSRARVPWICAAFVALALCASFTPGLAHRLRLERHAVADGEFWRLATAHFVHEWPRLALIDLGMLAILGTWLELRRRTLLVATLLASAALSSAAVWVLRPDLSFYEGSSALGAGAFVAIAIELLRDGSRARAFGAVMLLAWLAKTIAELVGKWPAEWSAAPPGIESVAIAHAAGGLGAALVAACVARTQSTRMKARDA